MLFGWFAFEATTNKSNIEQRTQLLVLLRTAATSHTTSKRETHRETPKEEWQKKNVFEGWTIKALLFRCNLQFGEFVYIMPSSRWIRGKSSEMNSLVELEWQGIWRMRGKEMFYGRAFVEMFPFELAQSQSRNSKKEQKNGFSTEFSQEKSTKIYTHTHTKRETHSTNRIKWSFIITGLWLGLFYPFRCCCCRQSWTKRKSFPSNCLAIIWICVCS